MSKFFAGVVVGEFMGFDTVFERSPMQRATREEAAVDAAFILNCVYDESEREGLEARVVDETGNYA